MASSSNPLPPSVLAQILECLGEAGEVIRVAAASRCLWAAAAGPLPHVHTLVLRSSTQDLASLQQRFPNIQQLHVADGCRQWTCLGTWAASLRVLQANGTSFPLAAVLSPSLPRVSSASRPRHPHRQQHQQQQQYQQQQHQHQADVPAELRNLVHLQLQSTVTSAVKCRQHGSQCDCLDSTVLAVLLQQNPGLRDLDLAGNSCLPDRLLHAASLAAACSRLRTLDLSGCELVAPGGYLTDAFPALQRLDISNTAVTDADVQVLAAGLAALEGLALRGCRRVSNAGIDALAAAPALVSGCLTSLDLGGLTRPGSIAMACLTAAWAKGCAGRHSNSSSSSSSRPRSSSSSSSSSSSGSAVRGCAAVQLQVGFARTACINDQVLHAFVAPPPAAAAAVAAAPATAAAASEAVPAQQQQQQQQQQRGGELSCLLRELEALAVSAVDTQGSDMQQVQQEQQLTHLPAVGLCALHLAGCSGVSSSKLLELGACGALAALTCLDVCDTEAFRHPVQTHPQQQVQHQQQPQQQQQQGLAEAVLPDDQALPACLDSLGAARRPAVLKSVLPLLLASTRQQLRVLLLDGCYLDDASAAAVAAQGLPHLQELSLVGCRGLGNSGLRCLLGALPTLQQLGIGGSVSAWSEGAALQGLPVLGSLTQLRLMRRPLLRDADLAPLLAAASALRSLSLVGCYMLTDQLFELVAASSVPGRPGLQEHLTQLCITACDGFTGSSLARLRGVQQLRVSFCASLSVSALQHVVVSCKQLRLLELPASLQGLGFTSVKFGPAQSPLAGKVAARQPPGRRGGVGTQAGGTAALVLPQQGCSSLAQHLNRLKVTWL